MRSIGVLEAKTTLSALLDDIEKGGESVVITRHGRPVARLSAETAKPRRYSGPELLEKVRAFRDAQPVDPELDGMPWEQLKRLMRNEDRYD